MSTSTPPRHTADPAEQARFGALSASWWDPHGPLRALHHYNPVRLAFIRQAANEGLGRDLAGLTVLDVGCGGGILSEPLARLGARVTGLDASAPAIKAARTHAQASGLAIDYRHGELPDLQNHDRFDVVIASEVIEHVTDPAVFLTAACARLVPGGILVISTFNRTVRSFLLGVVAAEQVLHLAPAGTHDWRRFIRPSEIKQMLDPLGLTVGGIAGARYHPLSGRLTLAAHDLSVNYLLWARKKGGHGIKRAGSRAPRKRGRDQASHK